MSEKKTTTGRTRNYATVVYPESAADDWMESLADAKVPAFISPLHDEDVNPDGEKKKAHYHVLLMFEGPKTPDQARQIFDEIGGVGCEVVNSLRGYARYLCHMDNPEKYQYDPDQVRSFCGADYFTTVGLPTDKYKAIAEMLEWCIEHHETSYWKLLIYAKENRYDWFRVLCDNGTMVIKEALKSKDWTEYRQSMPDDPPTV